MNIARADRFDFGLHPVRHFTELQRTGQARTALERMQSAQYLAACGHVLRSGAPLAQGAAQLWQQLARFFLENWKEVRIEHIDEIDIVGFTGLAFERALRENFSHRQHLGRPDLHRHRRWCGFDTLNRHRRVQHVIMQTIADGRFCE